VPFFAADSTNGETVREYRIRDASGQIRWIRDRRFHMVDDEDKTVRVGGIAEDVTERKRRELADAELLAREREARAEAEAAGRRRTNSWPS
jgi:uncharacterized membrane protein YqiK